MPLIPLNELFHFDSLAQIISALVVFIGLFVASFASRYLKGDPNYSHFFVLLGMLIVSVITMASANNLLILIAAWGVSCLALANLMVHKKSWNAARASGNLALKTLAIGFVLIAIAFGLLYNVSESLNIQHILANQSASPLILLALTLLALGAMTQSGIWPFHKWLISSLNSPTPVSAIMHAGLVNGAGIILARFAPLYLEQSALLSAIFILGLVTALLGTLWKLLQSDVKRMLACSTMGQMGFMVAQAGLGLFPAAVAHLCLHGMFKAYLFLASGNAAQERRLDLGYPPSIKVFLLALICGVAGSYGFTLTSGKTLLATDTTLVLIIIALIAGAQFAMPILRNAAFKMLPLALIATTIMGIAYGASVHLAEIILAPMNIMQPQPLNVVHIISIAVLTLAWLAIVFGQHPERKKQLPNWMLRFYVKALNGSQPHPRTITANRNTYKIV